jgi:hypothetical protein
VDHNRRPNKTPGPAIIPGVEAGKEAGPARFTNDGSAIAMATLVLIDRDSVFLKLFGAVMKKARVMYAFGAASKVLKITERPVRTAMKRTLYAGAVFTVLLTGNSERDRPVRWKMGR